MGAFDDLIPERKGGEFADLIPPAPIKPTDLTDWKKVGANLPKWQRELVSSINGWVPGFADEAVGGGVALASRLSPEMRQIPFKDVYRSGRDIARGAQESYQKEHPFRDAALNTAIALSPGSVIMGGLGAAAKHIPGPAVIKAAVAGVLPGMVTGAGSAPEIKDIPEYAGWGGATSALTSAGMTGVNQAGSAVWNNAIKPRLSQRSAQDVASRKVAEAFARDQIDAPQIRNTLDQLGPEARLVDAGGMNTKSLLDLQGSLPGKTQNALEKAIRDRQAGRASRLEVGADDILQTQGSRAVTTISDLTARQKALAGPLYQKVNATTIDVDDELRDILNRARDALGEARKRATARGEPFILGDIEKLPAKIPLRQLDTVKQSLFDITEATRSPVTGNISGYGGDLNAVRRALTSKLDDMTIDPATKESFYKQARDAFAGEEQLKSAIRVGSGALKMRPAEIAEATAGMSASERQAFQIGAMESLRDKMGTEGGQTSLLKFWKEPATSARLQEIFPDFRTYSDFARLLSGESKLKGLESLGVNRNSRTMPREALADDQIGSLIGEAIVSKPSGIAGALKMARDLYGRAAMPEGVRDKIGDQLLSPRMDAEGLLGNLTNLQQHEAQRRAAMAGQGITLSTQLQQMLGR